MNTVSPLFIKARLTSGGVKENCKFAHLDIMQIVALEEWQEFDDECGMKDTEEKSVPNLVPCLRLHLASGSVLCCWDEDRTGIKEVEEMKAKFYQQAMNPSLVLPPAGMRR